jgi:hypothetical protein
MTFVHRCARDLASRIRDQIDARRAFANVDGRSTHRIEQPLRNLPYCDDAMRTS